MLLDLSGMHITEASAKPNGNEIGVRAHDTVHTEFLAFLFLTPAPGPQNAASCLQADLAQIRRDAARTPPKEELNLDGSDTHAYATMLLTYPSGMQHLYRYAGSGDQCLSMQLYPDAGSRLDLAQARATLARQGYDPTYQPTLTDKYTYAGILYRTRQYKAAAATYADFLGSLPRTKDTLRARRIATDNLGMSLGLTGDVDGARRVFLDAIRKDSGYPLYYYNLACADAEQGDAASARTHLQQAFDRRANVLPGESLPDPARDDSILKLKSDAAFWAFVQSLK